MLSCTLPVSSWARGGADHYDALIRDARSGNYNPALLMLDQRLQQEPHDRRAFSDFILISDWAGHSRQIIDVYERIGSVQKLDAQPLAAVARAYRNEQQWDKALMLYQVGERRFRSQNVFVLGHIMTLADARRSQDAIDLGMKLVAQQPNSADGRLALGYAYHMDGQPYASLAQASRAYDLEPGKAYVVSAYISALQQAQLPQAALREAQAHPDVMTPAQIRTLEADVAAQLTRVAAANSRGEASRFDLADQVLIMYDALISKWKALGPSAHTDVLRVEVDRLQALYARRRMQDVITSYESLLAQGVSIPDYALGDVGDAYLHQRQPDRAKPLLRRALAAASSASTSGTPVGAQTRLYYALTESGAYGEADAVLSAAVAEQPTWLYFKGNPSRQPNDAKLHLDLVQTMGALYGGRSLEAQQRLDQMVNVAPSNSSLRAARAQIYRARALPRHAERDLKYAENEAPRSIEVEVGQAATALDLQEWHQADLLRTDVMMRAPEDLSAQRLNRAWEVHNMSELQVSASRGVSTDSPVMGTQDFNIDSVLYSPPINENWRVFAGLGYSTGEFGEGRGDYHWIRSGAQWRSRNITAQAEISGNDFGYGQHIGGALSTAIDLNDHWQVGGAAALMSRTTPLRALKNDITANSLSAYLRWRGDERREWQFSLSASRFTDDNERIEADLSGRQRLYTTPNFKIDALLDLAVSRNTLSNTPYFNPASDLTVLPALQFTHTLYRHYETQWEQQLLIGVGTYSQQDFGTGGVFTIGYGQRFRYNDVLDIGFKVSSTARPYDGVRERDLDVFVDMTYRF
ncbi:poly-beta-1,6 N-acetyl-D-glucosamine export porin PgaA [Alcaligenaceae bacterium CGII-47]|nr:poly-beta-1,6 N-acetyl-D-glucosamine export porin PgaA [Alcaligenaceae bacterium CGII-47]